jgi:glycosyltransferase involved in cell wall biosynthesis
VDRVTADPSTAAGPLRVGVVVPSLSGGGAEFVAVQWAAYLRAHGHAVTMITTHQPGAELGDVPVVGLTAGSFPARVRQLREHVAGAGYDVLLGLMPHWNLLVLLAALAAPGGPATLISGRNVEAPLRRIHGLSYRAELALCHLLYRRADGYVAISHPVAAEAAGTYGLDPEKVWVVPNPSTGKDPAAAASVLRGHRTDAGGESVTLTVPARLVPQKRPALAVETAALLRDRHGVEASVDYFGAGPEESAVRAAAERLGVTVRFRGWVTSWFEAAAPDAVVLLPSAAEGFGNVLVEAAAAGMASVASSRALGVADAIVPNVTGVLAMSSAPDDFAAAVRRAMGLTPVSAPAWLERFSPEESGAKLLQVLRAVTDGRGQPRRTSEPASPYSRSA